MTLFKIKVKAKDLIHPMQFLNRLEKAQVAKVRQRLKKVNWIDLSKNPKKLDRFANS